MTDWIEWGGGVPLNPLPDMVNIPPHLEAYFVALNSYLDIDGAWRRELAEATDAIDAKWAGLKSEAYRDVLSAYVKVMPTHRKHAPETQHD